MVVFSLWLLIFFKGASEQIVLADTRATN
jgi:hypothetical protein